MKRLILFFAIIFAVYNIKAQNINILAIITNDYGPNAYFDMDNLESYGFEITVAAVFETVEPCPYFGAIPDLSPDILLSEINDFSDYDVIVIYPSSWRSGNPYKDILDDEHSLELIENAVNQNKPIWLTCTGAIILAETNQLQNVHIQGSPGNSNEYLQIYLDAGAIYDGTNLLPVIDNNIITTTRGMYFNRENMEAVTTVLEMQNFSKENIDEKTEFSIENYQQENLELSIVGGTEFSEIAQKTILTSDNNFVAVGHTFSNINNKSDIFITKFDTEGNIIWTNTFGNQSFDYAFDVVELENSEFVIAGSTGDSESKRKDFYIIKTDENGNFINELKFGSDSLDVINAITKTSFGDIYITGYTEGFNSSENDLYVAKLNNYPLVVWEKTFTGSASEQGTDIIQLSDGSILIAGVTGSYGNGNRDMWLIKIDENGNEIWNKTAGTSGSLAYDWCNKVIETSSGDFVLVGNTNASNGQDLLFVRTDNEGNMTKVTKKSIGFYDYFYDVIEVEEDRFLLCGTTRSTGFENQGFVMITDNDGIPIWTEVIGENSKSNTIKNIFLIEEDIYFGGYTNCVNNRSFDFWVGKKKFPELVSTNDNLDNNQNINVFPNPANDFINIENKLLSNNIERIEIYNTTGEIFKNQVFNTNNKINISELKSGIYIIKIYSKTNVLTKQIIKY